MLTEPFESDQTKKWSQLGDLVKDMYRKMNECVNKPFFSFRLTDLIDRQTGEKIGVRIYALGPFNNGTESTLLYSDVTMNETLSQYVREGGPSSEFLIDQPAGHDDLDLITFKWNELLRLDLFGKDGSFFDKLSTEEKLQMECKRLLVSGITNYDLHEKQRRIVFNMERSLYYFDDNGTAPYLPIKLNSKTSSAKLNPTICPHNADLVAYVGGDELFVLNIQTGVELQLTNNKVEQPDRKIITGLPSYIIQEEFNRYDGFWWQPANTLNPNQFSILFEQVDETDVEIINIATFDGAVEEHRYSKPGKKNAISTLKIANFVCDLTSNQFSNVNLNFINDLSDLKQIYADFEYLINCRWYTQDSIVVQLLNRKQQNSLLFLLSVTGAFETQVIYEEINPVWVNTSHVCEFVSRTDDDEILKPGDQLTFIWTSQESGYRHLYKISVELAQSNDRVDVPLRSRLLSKVQLTTGNWECDTDSVWLDNQNRLVYFIGLKDSPLEKQLYVISLNNNNEQELIKKLTTSGYSNSLVVFNKQYNLFLNIQSSISKPPFAFLNQIQHSNAQQLPSTRPLGYILSNKTIKPDGSIVSCLEFEMLPGFSRPELFTYQLKESGDIVYGLIYKPDFMQADKKYPCVLEVYGGPCVQMVTNNFKSTRTFSRHILASQGYVVCLMDCRGSANRGLAFESHSNRRLGQVEVEDQVEVLQWLASSTNYIDLNRVAVYGFSYGGYLSLLCYAKRPDIFRLAIAGAPVTCWQLYDTGYTERYMDTPENNEDGYAKGSVLNHVSNFPSEENRLLIIHGTIDENVHLSHSMKLIHELIKSNKPYNLQIYPNERHSLPKSNVCTNFVMVLLSFLNQNM